MGIAFAKVFSYTFITEDVQVLFAACICRTEGTSTYVVSTVSFLDAFYPKKCIKAPPQKEESCSNYTKEGNFFKC